MKTRTKTIYTLVIASLTLVLTTREAATQNADYSDFGGGYSGQLTITPGPGISSVGPAILLVAPSRNGQTVRIDIQGNFVLTDDQFVYDSTYRINRKGKVKTSNLILFANEEAGSLDLTASSRAKLKGKRLKIRFIKTVGGTPVVSSMQLKFGKRNVACQYGITTGISTATISGNLRKRVGT